MSSNERGIVTEESRIAHYPPVPPPSRGPSATVRGIRLTKSKACAAIRFLWSIQRRSPAGEISIGNRRPRQGPAGPLAERAELAATVPAFDMLLYTAVRRRPSSALRRPPALARPVSRSAPAG